MQVKRISRSKGFLCVCPEQDVRAPCAAPLALVRSRMKKRNQTSDGKVAEHAHGLGTVTHEMVSARAREIALINRRLEGKPTPEDWAEAKRELTDARGTGSDPAEEVPVSKRWDPANGAQGHINEPV